MASSGYRLFLSAFLFIGNFFAQHIEQNPLKLGKPQIITEDFSRYVQKVLDENNVKGLSLVVLKASENADGDVELGSWGVKTEDGDAVDSKTLFSIGSCSKAFLATSLGILMDDFATGKNITPLPDGVTEFNWQSKLADLLPNEWKLMDEWASEKANVRDILSHVSGLVGHDFAYGPGDNQMDTTLRLRHLDTPIELRQHTSYNNMMYMTASYLLSIYANRTFPEFVQERLFKPLGMLSTTMSPSEAMHSGQLSQAWSQPMLSGEGQLTDGRRIPFWFTEELAQLVDGAGAIISNVGDMAKWVDVHLHKGVIPSTNTTVIPRAVFDAVTTSSAVWTGNGNKRDSIMGYGMGWFRYSSRGYDIVTHGGSIPGFQSNVAFLPHNGLAVVSFTNTDHGYMANDALLRRIVDDYQDLSLSGRGVDKLPSEPIGPFLLRTNRTLSRGQRRRSLIAFSLDDYAGTYTNPGYGSIALCSSEDKLPNSACASVIHDFATVDNATGRAHEASLLAHWPRAMSSHIRLIPTADADADKGLERFDAQPATLFPKGYGKDDSPWEYSSDSAPLRFVRAESQNGVKGPVVGLRVCGIAGRGNDFGDACERFAVGEEVMEGWLVHFDKVET